MATMTDERNFKAGNTEISQEKLLSRKDNSAWQGNTETEQTTVIWYYLRESMSTENVVNHKTLER